MQVLAETGPEGLMVGEIARRIQQAGLRDLRTSKTPEASLYTPPLIRQPPQLFSELYNHGMTMKQWSLECPYRGAFGCRHRWLVPCRGMSFLPALPLPHTRSRQLSPTMREPPLCLHQVVG